jgi:hypothetical protein
MKMLMTILAIALVASTAAYASDVEHEMFRQICVLLELNEDEQQKLAVAFVTLEENLDAATAGVGDENVDPRDMIDDFGTTRRAFRDSVGTFLSPEQFKTMMKYSSAIFYELAEDIARVRVTKFKESLALTDDQMTALTLVVNEELRSVVEAFLVYDEGDIDQSVADALSKSLLEIRENTRTEVKKILTEDQWAKFQQMREQSQAESG